MSPKIFQFYRVLRAAGTARGVPPGDSDRSQVRGPPGGVNVPCHCCSVVSDSAPPWTVARQVPLSPTVIWSMPKFMSIELGMTFNHLILCCPLLLLPSIFPSIRVFSNELALHIRQPKYWSSASASVLPMNIQGCFPLGLTGWISLKSKRLSRVFSV